MKEDWKDNLDIIDLDPTGAMPIIPVLPGEEKPAEQEEEAEKDGSGFGSDEAIDPGELTEGEEAAADAGNEEAFAEEVDPGDAVEEESVSGESASEEAASEDDFPEDDFPEDDFPDEEVSEEASPAEESIFETGELIDIGEPIGRTDRKAAKEQPSEEEEAAAEAAPEAEPAAEEEKPKDKVFRGEISIDTMLLTDVSDEIALNMEDTRLIPSLDVLSANTGSMKTRGVEEDESDEEEKAALLAAQTQVAQPRPMLPPDTIKIPDIDELLPEIDISDALENGEEAYTEGEAIYPEEFDAEPGEEEGFPDEAETGEGFPSDGTEEGVAADDAPEEEASGNEAEENPDDDYEEEERIFETGELIGISGLAGTLARTGGDGPDPDDEGPEDGAEGAPVKKPRKHEKPRRRKTRGRRGSGRRFALIFLAATLAVCLIAGVIILLLGKQKTSGDPPLYDVGQKLAAIGTAGQSGLIAMAEAEKNVVPPPEEDKPTPTPEPDETILVKLSFTSVEQDIKIKFIDAETDRLIRDVAFAVVLTPDGGATLNLTDEDKDGIIYKKEVKSGQYRFAVADAPGYEFRDVPNSVNVREKIVYQKIDVKDEIKSEAEVNAKVEDTGNNKPAEETPEPANKDTVEWVESSKTPKEGSDGYKKVSADDIPEPAYAKGDDQSAKAVAPAPVPVPVPAASAMGVKKAPAVVRGEEQPTSIPLETATPTPTPTEGDEPTPTKGEGEEGSATPTPTKGDGEEGSATPTPTAAGDKDPRNDKTTKLTDKNGKQLYYKDGDKYVEAVYADYYTKKEFFIASEVEYIYTGWQTLNGNTYYFDKNGNYVTGDQVIKGVSYHFNDEGILAGNTNKGILGIDVSKWNGSINWTAVKNAGVNFVIIRCGYRGSSTGVLVEDPTFRSNIQGARAAGLKVGLYFFTQAVNEVEAVEEASMCLSLASAYEVSYPIFIDVEFTVNKNGRADGLNKAGRTAVCRAFCETIRNGGYTAGVYSSKSWFGNMIDINSLSGYRVWLAHYTKQTDYAGHYDIWQYSSKGSIDGIKGNVDMNWSYLGY